MGNDTGMKINPDDYEIAAECIRSGQVPDADIVAMMDEDAEFRAWYLSTIKAKTGSPTQTFAPATSSES